VSITHPEMKRFFMTIPEAVHLVLQAGGIGRGGELFVLKMGDPLRIVELVEDLVRLSGLTVGEIPIVYTGLRPGEKLEEALWEKDAVVEETEHPEVLRVTEPEAPRPAFAAQVDALVAAAAAGDVARLESLLANLIAATAADSTGPAVDSTVSVVAAQPR
jgi:FlaA1/EpsC-like NDP-sugar epimerase